MLKTANRYDLGYNRQPTHPFIGAANQRKNENLDLEYQATPGPATCCWWKVLLVSIHPPYKFWSGSHF